jgi:hypothetical protein
MCAEPRGAARAVSRPRSPSTQRYGFCRYGFWCAALPDSHIVLTSWLDTQRRCEPTAGLCEAAAPVERVRYHLAMRSSTWMLLALCGCGGGPLLQNLPRPNPAAVAGVAAAVAGAATLADPQGAARRQEAKDKGEPDNQGVEVHEHVPADVLDRLDRVPVDAGVDAAPPDAPVPDAAR